jgi:beta-carotene 15,15'-dioxygenase
MSSQLMLFSKVRLFSSAIVGLAAALFLLLQLFSWQISLTWQIGIAITALAIGIPHGALDHLVTLPKSQPRKMALFIITYVAVAVVAVLLIAKWNLIGFQLVLLMSLIHFGIGDLAFMAELKNLSEKANQPKSRAPNYLAFGAVPVLIPLLKDESIDALTEINIGLVNWYQEFRGAIWLLVILVVLVTTLDLLRLKRNRDLLDLFLLTALALIAPPLISFAIYFGCWHAMRHTARLTLSLPKSLANFEAMKPLRAFCSAVIPGTPALVLTFAAAGIFWQQEKLDNSFLWSALVIVWALTVPHMAVTAKLDRAALNR